MSHAYSVAIASSVPPNDTRSWNMKSTTRPPSCRASSAAVIPSHASSCGRNAPLTDCAIANSPDSGERGGPEQEEACPDSAVSIRAIHS